VLPGDHAKIARVPRLTKNGREGVSVSPHHAQGCGEFGLDDHQPAIRRRRVVVRVGISYGVDESFAAGEPVNDAILRPFLICLREDPSSLALARALPTAGSATDDDDE